MGVSSRTRIGGGHEPLSAAEVVTPSYVTWGDPDAHGYQAAYTIWTTFMGKRILWHKWAMIPLATVERDLKAAGYGPGHWWHDIQTYNNRFIAGTHSKSLHSWPLALDIDVGHNPQGRPLRTDFPSGLVACFERHGFRWGGRWSTPDSMHMEYIGQPVKGDVPQPKEEPDMTDEQWKVIRELKVSAVARSFDLPILSAMFQTDTAEIYRQQGLRDKAVAAKRKELGL